MKLLIVEDSIDLSRSIGTYLRREGYVSEIAMDFREALDKLLGFTYDVVLLDIMIPKGDGLRLLEELKVINKQTGVIIISAKDALDDKVKGLELGADDYLTKPFSIAELSARIKALFRRVDPPPVSNPLCAPGPGPVFAAGDCWRAVYGAKPIFRA